MLFKDISEITGDQRGLIYTQKLTMSLFCCATEDLKLSLMLSGTLVYVKERSTQDPAKWQQRKKITECMKGVNI